MIIIRTQEQPSDRRGFLVKGKATASTGVLTITFLGKDYSANISGIVITPVLDSATTIAQPQITSVSYANGVNTILARVFVSNQITAGLAFSLTNSIVCHYSFWVDENDLPSNLAESDPSNLREG
jgi:hypothetical protein